MGSTNRDERQDERELRANAKSQANISRLRRDASTRSPPKKAEAASDAILETLDAPASELWRLDLTLIECHI